MPVRGDGRPDGRDGVVHLGFAEVAGDRAGDADRLGLAHEIGSVLVVPRADGAEQHDVSPEPRRQLDGLLGALARVEEPEHPDGTGLHV